MAAPQIPSLSRSQLPGAGEWMGEALAGAALLLTWVFCP